MQEIRSSFYFFDEDKTQLLDHMEFKRCLRSLGFDVGAESEDYSQKYIAILDMIDIDR